MAATIDNSVLTGINGVGATRGASSTRANGSQALNDNFMTMMVAQLKNQDPLKPMNNSEMVSQLAQINTLNGIEDLNGTLQGIGSQIDAGRALEAAGLIGQGVLVPGDRVLVGRDTEGNVNATPFGMELSEPAENVKVTITDGAGQVVRRYDIGSVDAGVSSFQWDGETDQGNFAPDGAYRIGLEATQGGEELSIDALNYAMVNAVTPTDESGGFALDLGAVQGQVGLSAIKQIL
ncbi:flagellar basal-body rod modification protein FlgD [Halomonas fontilapidosi]|uniref:Basal-body rod modification protein FlgD n=1 Tax=Halomonas fontilapidosi TaxID=616675 RepID=A0A7W5DIQ7_9GAMM|nr:flagellar hook assembly protein FlgD [Halomonas fontilapidosi]MBB3182878.1 flagellar basal-body rod modification protein FlgD [Halomonas fontilapidosi]